MFGMRSRPEFEVSVQTEPATTLLAGFSEFGLAGLTAVDYLVRELELEQTGHIAVGELPSITPFENGTPRHHTRLYSRDDVDLTVLVGELFVPAWAAEPFAGEMMAWAERNAVEELVVLSGIPFAHGPDDHRPFYVATPSYQEARLADLPVPTAGEPSPGDEGESGDGPGGTGRGDAPGEGAAAVPVPMSGGFLDGVNGSLMERGLDAGGRTCVLTTPAHPQTPDAEAALRLLAAVDTVYDLGLDTGPLEEFADRVSSYYEELAARMESARDEGAVPEDRMYM